MSTQKLGETSARDRDDRMSEGVPPPRPLAAFVWMVVASILFTVMGISTRIASRHLPWSEVAAVRALFGAVVALAVAKLRGASLEIHDRKTSWFRSISGSLAMTCTFATLGASTIAVGDAVTLGATAPIFIALLGPWLLGEKSGSLVWIATGVAFVGASLIAGPSFHLSGALVFVALLGALFTSMSMIFLRRLGRGRQAGKPESPEAIVVHFSLVAGATLFLIALPTLRAPTIEGGCFALLTAASGAFAQIAMTRAYQLDRAARVGIFSQLNVVLTMLASIVVLHERASLTSLVGMVLVLSAGVAVTWAGFRETKVLGRKSA